MLALFQAHKNLLRALWRQSSSSFSSWLVEHTGFALCLRVLMTLYFAGRWWLLSQCKHMSVWLGFLKSVVFNDPSGCGITIVSSSGIDPSGFASSAVNWMCGSTLFIC